MKVKRNTLLLIACLVWSAAGVNILRIGIAAYPGFLTALNVLLSGVVFGVFQRFIFGPLVVKHTARIRAYREERQFFLKFFDRKAFLIMAVMMTGGIGLRVSGLAPERFIAVFYSGLGASLLLAGILFGRNYGAGFSAATVDKSKRDQSKRQGVGNMKYTFGLIGAGNMGGAIAQAASHAMQDGILCDHDQEKAKNLAAQLGFTSGDNQETARESRYLFLGVKPHLMAGVLEEIAPTLAQRETPPILVSMAAGVTIAQLQAMAGTAYPVIRIMPNTPVSVGQGVILYTASPEATPAMVEGFLSLLSRSGKLYPIEESLMDVGAAVSGCGPAYAYLVMDALADGGVACGLPRPDAIRYAAQTLLGAAQMVLETGKHPEQLKNEVCSPGGSTIQGVRTLEQHGVRAAMMEAVIAACEKNAALGG